jgi:RNA polymerase sigma-70 factor (ECF subfamily)
VDLVAALRRGDTDLFADLVDAWSPAMLRIARAHVANHHAAEDVVQETWIAALHGLDRFEGRSSLRSWLCAIAVNIARRQGTWQRRMVPVASLDSRRRTESEPTVDPERFQRAGEREPGGWRQFPMAWPSPEEAAVNTEVWAVITAAMARLPERQRVVMELRDLHGYDGQEVADLLSVNLGNQRVLLHRARALVRRELETYFAGRPR